MASTTTQRLLVITIATATVLGMTACTGANGAPGKASIKTAVTKIVKDQSGDSAPSEMLEPVIDCLVDEAYDKLSTEGKKLFATGDADRIQNELSKKDVDVWIAASKNCEEKVLKTLSGK